VLSFGRASMNDCDLSTNSKTRFGIDAEKHSTCDVRSVSARRPPTDRPVIATKRCAMPMRLYAPMLCSRDGPGYEPRTQERCGPEAKTSSNQIASAPFRTLGLTDLAMCASRARFLEHRVIYCDALYIRDTCTSRPRTRNRWGLPLMFGELVRGKLRFFDREPVTKGELFRGWALARC
jgi:hypothetical protein